MRVTIIGVGGIGSHLADWIARHLAWSKNVLDHTLTLVDGDTFEDRNAERQAFEFPGMKASVVAETLSNRYPKLQVDAITEFLSPSNTELVLIDSSSWREAEIVLVCVDNHATRKLVSDTCGQMHNISVISGGNDLDMGTVQIYLRKDGQDATPSLTQDHPEIAQPTGKAPYEMSCEELAATGVAQVFFANLTAAVLMANAFWRLANDQEKFISDIRGDSIKVETGYTEVYFDIYRNLTHSRKHSVQEEKEKVA